MMKRVILLLGICFCISGLYAQKLESIPLDEHGDAYETKLRNFGKLYGTLFMPEKVAPLVKEKAEDRKKWREENAARILTGDWKELLKRVGKEQGGSFWITYYIDTEGKVLTVKFVMSSSVYIEVTTKMLRELYNRLLNERLDPSCYAFDDEHVYAIEAVELMQRAVEGE